MKELRDEYVDIEHVLLAMVEEGGIWGRLNVTKDTLLAALQKVRGNQRVTGHESRSVPISPSKNTGAI